MRIVLYLALLFTMVGCFASKLVVPNELDFERGSKLFADFSMADLSEGHKLYKQHCGTCHKYIAPSAHTEAEWRKIVPAMSKKVNKKYPGVLSTEGEDKILKYVLVMRER